MRVAACVVLLAVFSVAYCYPTEHADPENAVEDHDEAFSLIAFVKQYGCTVANVAALMCKGMRNGEIDTLKTIEDIRSAASNDDIDQIDMNQVKGFVKTYGCPFFNTVNKVCLIFGKNHLI